MEKEEKNLLFEFIDDVFLVKYYIISIIIIFIILAYVFNNIYKTKYNIEIFFSPQTRDYANKLTTEIEIGFSNYYKMSNRQQAQSESQSKSPSEVILDDFVAQFETHKQLKNSVISNSSFIKNFNGSEKKRNEIINKIASSYILQRPNPKKGVNLWKIRFQTSNFVQGYEEGLTILNDAVNNIFNDVNSIYFNKLNTDIIDMINIETLKLKNNEDSIS